MEFPIALLWEGMESFLELCELKAADYFLQGKSLSLISGSLTWLKDYEERQQKELENAPTSTRKATE